MQLTIQLYMLHHTSRASVVPCLLSVPAKRKVYLSDRPTEANSICSHTETDVADQTCHLTQFSPGEHPKPSVSTCGS